MLGSSVTRYASAALCFWSACSFSATTSCPVSYVSGAGPVVDCEVGSQRRATLGTYDASTVNADRVFGLTDWSVAFNSTYTVRVWRHLGQ